MRLLFAASLLALSAAFAADARRCRASRPSARLFEKSSKSRPSTAAAPSSRRLTDAARPPSSARRASTNVIVKDHDNTQTLIARWPAAKPSGKKPILLMAHMDVVEAKASDWKNEPFEFREQDGYYLGRGTNDNKAGLTGIVLALLKLKAAGFKPTRDLIVLFTGDEETSGNGARRAATEWRELTDAEYALNGDAGGGGYKDGRVEASTCRSPKRPMPTISLPRPTGAATAAAPRPDNAIYELADALKALEAHRFTPMLNDATRAYFELIGRQGQGQLQRAGQANGSPTRTTARRPTCSKPTIRGLTRTRCVATDAGGRPCRQCAAAKGAKPTSTAGSCRASSPKRSGRAAAAGRPGGRGDDREPTSPDPTPSAAARRRVEAYQAAVAHPLQGAPIVPLMSTGATDGAYSAQRASRSTASTALGHLARRRARPRPRRAHAGRAVSTTRCRSGRYAPPRRGLTRKGPPRHRDGP